MKIIHTAGTFPKSSATFILNQLVGLRIQNQEFVVFASPPDSPVDHDVVDEWNLLEDVIYTQRATSYKTGVRLLIDAVPSLLRQGYGFRKILSQFRHGKQAPGKIGAIRDFHSYSGIADADLVHAHFGTRGIAYLPAVREYSLPFVVSFYGYDISQIPRSDPSAYDELFSEVTAVTCLSEDMRDDLIEIGCPPDRIHKIPLCIDPTKFTFQERTIGAEEPVRILTVARHVEKKGLEYAIRAVAELDSDRDITYTIAGDGPRREQLETLVDELGVNDRIEMVGWVSQEEVSRLMSDSHIFVLPSVTAENGDKEGTPTVLLEAQSSGLPVVSTRHAGIPEIVQDGESGLLVPERDVNSLVQALQDMLSAPEQWSAMGHAGREYVEARHSIDTVSEELITLYNSIVSS